MRMADIRPPDAQNENMAEKVIGSEKHKARNQIKKREPITDIRTKMDYCCIKRRETIAVFRKTADSIQSFVYQPKCNLSQRVRIQFHFSLNPSEVYIPKFPTGALTAPRNFLLAIEWFSSNSLDNFYGIVSELPMVKDNT